MSTETKKTDAPEASGWLERFETKFKKHIYIGAGILGVLVFIAFPMLLPKGLTTLFPSFTHADMTGRWISVFMSMFLSVIVTHMLLEKQTERQQNERKEERETQFEYKKQEKIYEEKLKAYKEYWELLGGIIAGKKLDPDDEVKLRVSTASLAIHTSAAELKEISRSVKTAVLSMCDERVSIPDLMESIICKQGEEIKEVNAQRVRSDALLTSLMNISKSFRNSLYENNTQSENDFVVGMKEHFAELFELANSGAGDDTKELNIDSSEDVERREKEEDMEDGGNTEIHPNWTLKLGKNSTWKKLSLEPKGGSKYGEIYIRPWGDRCAMVMRYLNEKGAVEKGFADEVKYWGFYRSNLRTVYGEWRNCLDDDQWCKKYDAQKVLSNGAYPFSKEIKSDEFLTRYKDDGFFRSHLENTLKSFVEYIEQYRRRCDWKACLSNWLSRDEASRDNLKIYSHITSLWCDYGTSANDGFVRLSFNEEKQKDDSRLVRVQISRYKADAVFESLLDKLSNKLNKTKEQLTQEVNEKGHIRVDSFYCTLSDDRKTVIKEQTDDQVKAVFEEWHQIMKGVQ